MVQIPRNFFLRKLNISLIKPPDRTAIGINMRLAGLAVTDHHESVFVFAVAVAAAFILILCKRFKAAVFFDFRSGSREHAQVQLVILHDIEADSIQIFHFRF